ncbi:MAG: nickel transporter [Gammaproteobacteria bacterium]|nr:nickel transporter [Gammaproteobacteria bacterium]
MDTLPNNWLALLAVVFLLGLRHGLDADHLATIDGITRFNASVRPRLARWSGFLFSLGHGMVVIVVAILVALFSKGLSIPDWMDGFGAWVSIIFLLALGTVNLITVLRASPDAVVQPAGLKGRFLGRLNRAGHPWLIVLVGTLFALSFDTMSQAALFSLAASKMSGWVFSAILGLTFMAGMMVTDGVNGLWVSRLLRRADRRARIASRVLGLTIALLSFGVAILGIAEYWSPQAADWGDGYALYFGIGVVLIVLTSYVFALLLTRSPAAIRAGQ